MIEPNEQELNNIHLMYVDVLEDRLNYFVEREEYETAARFRDLIKFETTEDEEYKHQYYLELIKRYAPECPEFYERMKRKYETNTIT